MSRQIVLTQSIHAHLSHFVHLLRGQADGDIPDSLDQELARADVFHNDEFEQTIATMDLPFSTVNPEHEEGRDSRASG